jgi:hypothetical protein
VGRIEKYDAQRTMVSTTMDATFFRSFFNQQGVRISPPRACTPHRSSCVVSDVAS